jgi:hypothetical protein
VAAAAGLPVTQFQYCQLGELMLSRDGAKARGELEKALKPLQADLKRIVQEVKPLHWELEFPDVFREESGGTLSNPGFDAILGNPPYISTQTSSEFSYRDALGPRFGFADDLYVHFVFQSFRILREGGPLRFHYFGHFLYPANKASTEGASSGTSTGLSSPVRPVPGYGGRCHVCSPKRTEDERALG